MQEADIRWAQDKFTRLSRNIESVIKGQATAVRHILAGIASRGHILLKDNPGTGKTTLAKALAKSIDADFKRIQFTPDLLPSDILGVYVYDPSKQVFTLHKGPVFTNILLADEINRASPRTQSALLESMAEGQVSIDGHPLDLENLFFVIATQNPVESRGTYPLPEAQMDRFCMQLELGYVSPEEELAILSGQKTAHPLDAVSPCMSLADLLKLGQLSDQVFISQDLKQYIVALVRQTREMPGILLGASPRAAISLMKTACCLALIDGQAFVLPDHIQEIAVHVMAHRLMLDPQATFSGTTPRRIVEDVLSSVAVPV